MAWPEKKTVVACPPHCDTDHGCEVVRAIQFEQTLAEMNHPRRVNGLAVTMHKHDIRLLCRIESSLQSCAKADLLEIMEYDGGEQTWCQIQTGHETAFKSITGGIFEFPISFLKIGPLKIPLGGGYF